MMMMMMMMMVMMMVMMVMMMMMMMIVCIYVFGQQWCCKLSKVGKIARAPCHNQDHSDQSLPFYQICIVLHILYICTLQLDIESK